MWISDNWKDYEVLDTSDGEKLERWGKYLLVRPDPQVNNMHRLTVALQTSVNFMSAAKGKKLTARSRCIKNGRTTGVYVVDVTDELGTAVAQFVGTGYKL